MEKTQATEFNGQGLTYLYFSLNKTVYMATFYCSL